MTERIIVVICALALDAVMGDPHISWHPVRLIGRLITFVENMLIRFFKLSEERETDSDKKLFAGALLTLTVVLLSVIIPVFLLCMAYIIHPYFKTALEIIMCYFLLAMRSLKTESMKVYHALRDGDTEKAKKELSMIVGRDTQPLTAEGIARTAYWS